MISEILIVSIALAVFALAVTAALSPLETLSWWAGWTEREIGAPHDVAATDGNGRDQLYVVYLSGVASLSGKYLLRREDVFLQGLSAQLPGAVIISDVFPYSPAGLPLLAGPRLFDRFWRWFQKLDLQGKRSILRNLINLRNIYQVLVSADHRYGPIFSQGAAAAIERSLLNAGFQSGGGRVVIIGYSGGAQVAVGAAPFLKAWLGAPISVVSIGGVLASDPGIDAIDALHHFRGPGDRIEKLGAMLFAERWRFFPGSHWNRAKQEGRLVIHRTPDLIHAGPRGYFGLPRRGAQSNNECMQRAVANVLSSSG